MTNDSARPPRKQVSIQEMSETLAWRTSADLSTDEALFVVVQRFDEGYGMPF